MENAKEGGFLNRTPILNGINYDDWKPNMVDFLKSMDSKTWEVVIKGWTLPKVTTEDGTESLNPESNLLKIRRRRSLSQLSGTQFHFQWS